MGKCLVRDALERASFVILFLLAFKHPEGGTTVDYFMTLRIRRVYLLVDVTDNAVIHNGRS